MSENETLQSGRQTAQEEAPVRPPARKRLTFTAFVFASSVSLLLLVGALFSHWMTARALQQEIAILQHSNREPMGALFAVMQTSWEFYASPGDKVAYARFTETLARLPERFGSSATQVAFASESMRKTAPSLTETHSAGNGAQQLAKALIGLAQEASSLAERENADVLSSVQRYQDRATQLTWAGLLLGVAVTITGLAYVRRIEIVNANQYEELLREREKLKALSAQLLAAQEQERRAVARELHDGIGQSLSLLAMDATRAGALAPNDEQLKTVVANIRENAEQLLQSVRDLALELRPSMLDDLGLPAALDWLARETSRRGKVEVSLRVDGLETPLPERFRTCIYRVVQEGLTNAARHAAARNIDVKVERAGSQVLIEVRDDGRGFDPKLKQGLGLIGAAERLAGLGGQLRIESRPEGGTRFLAQLPVPGDAG